VCNFTLRSSNSVEGSGAQKEGKIGVKSRNRKGDLFAKVCEGKIGISGGAAIATMKEREGWHSEGDLWGQEKEWASRESSGSRGRVWMAPGTARIEERGAGRTGLHQRLHNSTCQCLR